MGFFSFCTSIVAQDSHGQIWHGRNLDYKYTSILRNITLVAHFQRNNKVAECLQVKCSNAAGS